MKIYYTKYEKNRPPYKSDIALQGLGSFFSKLLNKIIIQKLYIQFICLILIKIFIEKVYTLICMDCIPSTKAEYK